MDKLGETQRGEEMGKAHLIMTEKELQTRLLVLFPGDWRFVCMLLLSLSF